MEVMDGGCRMRSFLLLLIHPSLHASHIFCQGKERSETVQTSRGSKGGGEREVLKREKWERLMDPSLDDKQCEERNNRTDYQALMLLCNDCRTRTPPALLHPSSFSVWEQGHNDSCLLRTAALSFLTSPSILHFLLHVPLYRPGREG